MTTYYQDAEVRVTEQVVEVGTRVFPITELMYVWHERGRHALVGTSRRLGRFGLMTVLAMMAAGTVVVAVVVAGLVAAGVIVVPFLAAQEADTAVQVGVAVAVVALLAVVLAVLVIPLSEYPMMALERSYDRGTEVREIWVRWRDQDLLVLRTTDSARFGRIYRAIQRAVEQDEG